MQILNGGGMVTCYFDGFKITKLASDFYLIILIFAARLRVGAVAQLVEQWTENPCVAGSTPAHTTKKPQFFAEVFLFYSFWL
jgi:hypothetical protein